MFKSVTSLCFVVSFIVVSISAWATHVITCIENEQWGFLIAGAIAAPIGVIHGFGLWIGVW